MRRDGFVALDLGKKSFNKQHDVDIPQIQDGIKTEIDLTKQTLFAAGRGKIINAEFLFDKEEGKRKETIKSTLNGNRTSSDDAKSSYYGGTLDLRYIGFSIAGANYEYFNKFRVGEVPDLTARDQGKKLKYTTIKVGSALNLYGVRIGAYLLNQKSTGDFTYTFYDPTTGNKGTTETYGVSTAVNGFGAGIGFTLPKFRSELSLERMYGNKFDISDDYPADINKPKASTRMSVIAEAKISFIAVGIRFRTIKGNYADLEDIISSNLLYDTVSEDDLRTETSFNFSFGNSKGFSPSAFYTQSTVNTKEVSPVFDNGLKYKAVTKSSAYGVNLSYKF